MTQIILRIVNLFFGVIWTLTLSISVSMMGWSELPTDLQQVGITFLVMTVVIFFINAFRSGQGT